jgi:hypothetical protein
VHGVSYVNGFRNVYNHKESVAKIHTPHGQ